MSVPTSMNRGRALGRATRTSLFNPKIRRQPSRCFDSACSKPKPGRIDDGARPGLVALRCDRSSAFAESLEHLYSMRDGPDLIVIRSVSLQHAAQVRFAEHDEVVERFATDRSDEPLNVPVLPRRAWRRCDPGSPSHECGGYTPRPMRCRGRESGDAALRPKETVESPVPPDHGLGLDHGDRIEN